MCSFVSAAQGQNKNCCQIQVGGLQISGVKTTVVPSSSTAPNNGPGGTYISTQTDTYPIACIDSDTGKACNSTTTPANVVTATGSGANVNGNWIACNPSFTPTTSQANSTSTGSTATFEDIGTSYTGVDSNGVCIQNPNQPFAISSCIYVACSTTTSGPPPPDCSCCSGPLGAKLLGTPQQKDVKFREPQNPGSCYYDCPCCPAACSPQSPIVLDVTGVGYFLTDAAHGVLFDLRGAGNPIQIAWTAANANNAFLALPGADGLVHNGQQLFGNFTRQPPSNDPNGFAALAVYDLPANGGNGDGVIDSRDAVFSSLRLWIDANHDGISQPNELFTLPSLGVTSISLNYKWDQRTDQFGNVFRYRAQVNPGDPNNTGRVAYDVFFSILTSGGSITTAKCEVPGTKGLLATGKGLSKK